MGQREPLIPPNFTALDPGVGAQLVGCVEGMALPRFFALYVIGSGVVAVHTGHHIKTVNKDDPPVLECLNGVLRRPTGGVARTVILVDRHNRLAWVGPYTSANQFLVSVNPAPEDVSPD